MHWHDAPADFVGHQNNVAGQGGEEFDQGGGFGSIMIEENVVSAAGAPHRFTSNGIQEAIREAGFIPKLRTQQYEHRPLPEVMEQQVINY